MICILGIILIFFLYFGCDTSDQKLQSTPFDYPQSKLWAHRVNDTCEAKIKKNEFVGLELDLYYSSFQDNIWVAHDLCDTVNELRFDTWLSALSDHEKNYYWLDFKNLDINNANIICERLLQLSEQYHIKKHVMIESYDWNALKIIKDKGLAVILWIDNINDDINKDTLAWYRKTKDKIIALQPHAISSRADMYSLLIQSFPQMNIHLWNTPIKKDTAGNLKLTELLCKESSIKVVLVDYYADI
jgi:hypothetical protein